MVDLPQLKSIHTPIGSIMGYTTLQYVDRVTLEGVFCMARLGIDLPSLTDVCLPHAFFCMGVLKKKSVFE